MTSKKTFVAFAAFGAAALLSLVAATCGDTTTRVENSGTQEHGISVSGEGKATGKPDIAQITLGVTRTSDLVAAARDGAAASLDAMIGAITSNGVDKQDIQTQQFNISPQYDYTNGRQRLTGFQVTNVVSVKLRDITKTSKVVDDAVAAGGNDTQVQNISFTIDKPEDLQRQAREAAIADARSRADTIAKAAGVSVGDPISISEGGGVQPIPFAARAADAVQGAPTNATPIEPGTLDVTINVSVTWSIK